MSTTSTFVSSVAIEHEQAIYRKVTWRVVPLLIVCFIFAYLDRVNISFAKLQMQSDLGLNDAAYGLGASMFFVGYFLFEIPSNIIMCRVGAKRWIARIMISWGIASALMMFVQNETWFYILRFFIGATEAGFLPGIIFYFTNWFPAKRRASINAIFLTSIAMSGVIGGPLAGFIMTRLAGVNGWSGWQWLFLMEGLPTIGLGLLVLFWLDDSISKAKWLSPQEKTLLQANLDREGQNHATHSFAAALRQPSTIFLCLVYVLMLMAYYGLTFWMPQLIKNTGIASPMTIGLLTAIPYAAAGIAMVFIARNSDRTGDRKWHLGLCVLAGGVGYIICALFAHNTLVALLGLSLAAIGVIGCIPVWWTLPPKFLTGSGAAGGIALINSVGNLGGVVSPYMVGKVTDLTGSPTGGLYAIAAMSTLAALIILIALPRELAAKDKVV